MNEQFEGFPGAALTFYEGLEADNSKAYWAEHKHVYERQVRGPLEALVAELTEEFGSATLFRAHRDVRFSPDKSPYKTQVAAVLGDTGDGAYYVQLSADGLMTGAGLHVMTPAQVARLRAGIDDERTGAELELIVSSLRKAGFTYAGEPLRTAPRGYAKDHPRIALLRYRSAYVLREHGAPSWLHTRTAAQHVADDWRTARPLVEWLRQHVGTA